VICSKVPFALQVLRASTSSMKLSRLGLGTVLFGMDYAGYKELEQQEVDRILGTCIEKKINFIDTAPDYGGSEEKIGCFLKGWKSTPFLVATKIKKIPKSCFGDSQALRRHIFGSVEKSVTSLHINQLFLLQLHQFDTDLLTQKHFWSIIRELKEKGMISNFGLSLYEPEEADWLMKEVAEVVDFIQFPYNLLDQRFQNKLESLIRNSIRLLSRSVFLQGRLIPTAQIQERSKTQEELLHRITAFANLHHLRLDELALKYVLKEPFSSSILGVKSESELRRNCSILESEALNADLSRALSDFAVQDLDVIDPRKWVTA